MGKGQEHGEGTRIFSFHSQTSKSYPSCSPNPPTTLLQRLQEVKKKNQFKMHFSGILWWGSCMKGLDNTTPIRKKKNHTGTHAHILLVGRAARAKHIFGVVVPLAPFCGGSILPRVTRGMCLASSGEPASVPNNQQGTRVDLLINVAGPACRN